MSVQTNNKNSTHFDRINEALKFANENHSFDSAVEIAKEIVSIFGITDISKTLLYFPSLSKETRNISWTLNAPGYSDRKATYVLAQDNDRNIEFNLFWVSKVNKNNILKITALTKNFEDEKFNKNRPIGIDFIIPEEADKLIIVLSKEYKIRTLELSQKLNHTQKEIFNNWFQDFDYSNKGNIHEILWKSFDIHPLNEQFYREISSFFNELVTHLKNQNVLDEKHRVQFTSRLIGRIMFCWFLNKKEFINKEFKYFELEQLDSTQYYREKLEKLFFEVLNTSIDDRSALKELDPDCKDLVTPYLNGGLFEVKETDLYKKNLLNFPTDYFNRFYEFLNKYNFTTDESTSDFQQVAVDPEMLGRIFENLLAEETEATGEQARKAKGAFYTPREIVGYMCKESLKEFLSRKINDNLNKEKIINLLLEKKEHEFDYKNDKVELVEYKSELIDALDNLKIIDPACGSGAFPIGMLQLLIQCYERIEPRFDPYKTKLSIIKNNLYGVDIEPMAVEISRLRVWLSIIVDETLNINNKNSGIEPLPNLDFKFICANSLIPLNQSGERTLFNNGELDINIQEIRNQYFNTSSFKIKNKLKEKFEDLIQKNSNLFSGFLSNKDEQLITYNPFKADNLTQFFDSNFMFGVNGFDIVIGNPPYLRIQGIQKVNSELAKKYKSLFRSATGSYDLYVLFLERGLNILSEDGILNYILPHKWVNSSFGEGIRSIISKNKSGNKMISFGANQVFSATNYTSLLWLTKNENFFLKFYKFNQEFKDNHQLEKSLKNLKNEEFNNLDFNNLKNTPWILTDKDNGRVIAKIMQQPLRVKDIFDKIFQGIATSKDSVYFLENCIIKGNNIEGFSSQLKKTVTIEKGLVKPLLKGKQIHRYSMLGTNNYVIFPYHIHNDQFLNGQVMKPDYIQHNYSNGWKYLSDCQEIIKEREQGKLRSINEWYKYIYPKNITEFEQSKIITPEISLGPNMTYDIKGQFYHNTQCYSFVKKSSILENYKFYLGILNSSLLWFFLKNSGNVLSGGYFRFKTNYLEPFPIPKLENIDEQNHMVELVEQIIQLHTETITNKEKIKLLETQINNEVYKLYRLNQDEITIIENFNEMA